MCCGSAGPLPVPKGSSWYPTTLPQPKSQVATKHSFLRTRLGPKPYGKVTARKFFVESVDPLLLLPPFWGLPKLEEAGGKSSAPTYGCQIATTD